MAEDTEKTQRLTEIRITQPYTIQLIEDEQLPGEKTPARTIERALIELRTLRQVVERMPAQQPAA